MKQRVLLLTLACWLSATSAVLAQGLAMTVAANSAQIFVSGKELRFENLGTTRGSLVVRVDDPGLADMLKTLGGRLDWQPGTRFVAITRADGTLITATVGSDAISAGDNSIGLPFAPFYRDNQLYLPLLPLSQALGLAVHRFGGGYAFAPQILSAQRRVGQRRTILEIRGSAPLSWRTSYVVRSGHPTLTIQFPGFSNAAGARVWLGGRDARLASAVESGPPGFPITTLNVQVQRGVRFAVHRMAGGAALAVVFARSTSDLHLAAAVTAPALMPVRPPARQPALSMSAAPAPASPATTAQPVPTAQPLPPNAVNSPSGATSQPGESPEPDISPETSPGSVVPASAQPAQKVSDVFVTDTQDASRVTLVLSGSISFEWHRLGDPDNRFWVDIQPAELIGPARELKVKLSAVQSVKISQHELFPNHVVRLSVIPSQALDIRIGAVEGAPNQLGVEILSSPPQADAPTSGTGTLSIAQRPAHAIAARAPAQPNLIVIDPGHGGNDPGAINRGVGLVESHVTLTIAQRLKADLERAGWHVALTRTGDYEVGDPGGDDRQELQSRCDVANAAGARLFVSVHVNSSFSSSPNGVTTYYWRPEDRALAQSIQAAAAQAGGIADAGVHRENFYVIHHTFMPAVLIETAYLSNPHDASLLAQQWFMNKIADGIARGIRDFTGGPPQS